ncbi:MAG: bifunctional oligoribonuclease/PAP phosphatase NrnA [candidate division Zixibacteria bacterium]|nr:bifunctional oligoribonuclease/PAP phosphatase NrnA [candidate division Zixibacteria bacterium]
MPISRPTAQRIARLLDGAQRILISSHRDPDGDSIGCQLAFHEYWTKQKGRPADVLDHGTIPLRYRFLDPTGIIRAARHGPVRSRWDAAVIFECSSLDRVGNVARLVPSGLPIINIDHHERNDSYGTVNVLDSQRSACAELVFELLRLWKARITPRMAQLLAAAVLTDTGRFRHPSTNEGTLRTTAELLRLGADLTALTDRIYFSQPESHFRLFHHVLGQAELRNRGRICLLYLRASDRRRYRVPSGDMEGLVDFSLSLQGVRVGALLKERGPRKTKVSLRSSDSVDVAAVARQFGGGGHKNAAGCLMDLSLGAAADAIVKAIGPLPQNYAHVRAKSTK